MPAFPLWPLPSTALNFLALVAMECEVHGVPPVVALDCRTASILADALALDLARHIPEIRSLDFVMVGALYDQAQLLRPQWPLHAGLADALERLPREPGSAHVVALGSHGGRLPLAVLEPDRNLLGSPMLVVPWLLSGTAGVIGTVGARLEQELLDQGLIGPELALALGEAFGIKTVHARHLTTLDLCALACAQYEHAGLGGLWQIIETAVMKPEQTHSASLGDGSTLHYEDGVPRIEPVDSALRAQCRAILAAHGLELAAGSPRH